MSVVAQARSNQQKDKSVSGSRQATAEEIRLAQLTNLGEDESESHIVAQIMEVTGTTEDNARTALFDTNNDTNRAIELILEQGPYDRSNEWETAGRRRNKPTTHTTSIRGVDTITSDDSKDITSQWEFRESKGRGRGKSRSTRMAGARSSDRRNDSEQAREGGSESRERSNRWNSGPRQSRGRGGSYGRGPRQTGRGGPRRFGGFNRGRGFSASNDRSAGGNQPPFGDESGFGNSSPAPDQSRNSTDAAMWPSPQQPDEEEDWGSSLEMGSWANNDEAEKQHETSNDSFSEQWGTCSWTDGLSETKVFQSQTAQVPEVPAPAASPPTSQHSPTNTQPPAQQQHISQPQMGERIDIGTLFKKTYSEPGMYNSSGGGESSQHKAPSVIQQLQQHGQSNSLFSENQPPVVNNDTSSSRLFASYDQPASIITSQPSQAGGASLSVDQYATTATKPQPDAYSSQFNGGKKMGSKGGEGSSLLGSFRDQIHNQLNSSASAAGPGSNPPSAVKTPYTTAVESESQNMSVMSSSSDYTNFSHQQQKEATDAVKASLGLPQASGDVVGSNTSSIEGGRSASSCGSSSGGLSHQQQQQHAMVNLSFGTPASNAVSASSQRQAKQMRRKQPPVSSKIPASAVEMPSAASNYHEIKPSFDLQFGIDDNPLMPTSGGGGGGVSQSSIFGNGGAVVANQQQQQQMMNHLPTTQQRTMPDAMFAHQQHLQQSNQQVESRGIQRSTYQSLQPDLSQPINNQNEVQLLQQQQQHNTGSQAQHETATSSHANSQRNFSEAKVSEPATIRGPPGLPHPQSVPAPSNLQQQQQQSSSVSSHQQASAGGAGGYGASAYGGMAAINGMSSLESSQQSSNQASASLNHCYYATGGHSKQVDGSASGRSMRSPVPTSSHPASLQASPMQHQLTPSKDVLSGSSSTAISSLTGALAQSHISQHQQQQQQPSSGGASNLTSAGSNNDNAGVLSGASYGSSNGMPSHHSYSAAPHHVTQGGSALTASPSKQQQQQQQQQQMAASDLYATSQSAVHNSTSSDGAVMTSSSSQSLHGTHAGDHSSKSPASHESSTTTSSTSKGGFGGGGGGGGPPNLPLGVPPILPANQYGIPMAAPGLMTTYTPEGALYGYPDSMMAVQSRVLNQMPNYYDLSPFHNTTNPTVTAPNRETSSNSVNQGKFGSRGEPSSPSSVMQGMMGSAAASGHPQQQMQSGQHSNQLKAQTAQAATHQQQAAQHFMNLPAAYPAGYSQLYYNAFQYPPMFAAATAVPQNAKHAVNATTAFQPHAAAGFANAYSTASVNASSSNSLHELQGQGYNKSHVTLTAAMAAANSNAAAGAAAAGAGPAGMAGPYTAQTPFMTMFPAHQPSQIHLHLPQHGDLSQTVGSQRSQASNQLGKSSTKAPFGNSAATGTQYWAN